MQNQAQNHVLESCKCVFHKYIYLVIYHWLSTKCSSTACTIVFNLTQLKELKSALIHYQANHAVLEDS